MRKLTKEQILLLHQNLIDSSGGSPGLRDVGLLESAIYAPFQSVGDGDAYPSLQQKAARLGFGLIKNHAFIDGNKRIGVHAMLIFLALNGIELQYTQKDLSDMVLLVAEGALSFEEMVKWIVEHQE